jgi:hypothetical protein
MMSEGWSCLGAIAKDTPSAPPLRRLSEDRQAFGPPAGLLNLRSRGVLRSVAWQSLCYRRAATVSAGPTICAIFHRWNGRVDIVAAFALGVARLWVVWVPGTPERPFVMSA